MLEHRVDRAHTRFFRLPRKIFEEARQVHGAVENPIVLEIDEYGQFILYGIIELLRNRRGFGPSQ